ncbi:MAG TPA: hypothetical protein VG899_07900 [Mycobacteriales bacterium]|nr:hypothetical protein [Mycobacteriales bacterium]
MSEAVSDVLSNLREKAPKNMPSAKDATEAVRSHLPSVDVETVRSHLPSLKDVDPSAVTDRLPKGRSRWAMLGVVLGGVAAAAAVFGITRRRRASEPSASMYTPPLPKP